MIKNNGYEQFGKYLLSHLNIDNPDEFDWDFIIRGYVESAKVTKPGLMYINWLIANHFGMDAYEVRTVKTNKPEYTTPKHVAMYLAATLFRYTQDDIRDFYGLSIKNRSSVANALTKVEGWMQSDKYFKEDIESITNKLLGYEQVYKRPITSTIGGGKSFYDSAFKDGNHMLIDRDREVKSSD